MNNDSFAEAESSWERLAPQLDAALDTLSDTDRDIVILRFFERKSAREIAASLCLKEAAAADHCWSSIAVRAEPWPQGRQPPRFLFLRKSLLR